MSLATANPVVKTTVYGYVFDDDGVTPIEGAKVRFRSEPFQRSENLVAIDENVVSDADGRYQAELPTTVEGTNVLALVEVFFDYTDTDSNTFRTPESILVPETGPISVEAARAQAQEVGVLFSGPQGPKGDTGDQGPQGLPGSAQNVINLKRSVDGASITLDGSSVGETPDLYLIDPDTGDMTITIPDAGFSAGSQWSFYKEDTDANKITIQTVSGDLIGGQAMQEILQKTSGLTILDDVTEYRKIQDSRSSFAHDHHVTSIDGPTKTVVKPALFAEPDTGDITATLPLPVNAPDSIFILNNHGTSGNDLIINVTGGKLISGQATQTVPDGKTIMVFCRADEDTYDIISDDRDMSASLIKTLYESNADTNEFSDAEQTKLAGIEAGATGDQSDAEIKTAYENNADTNAFTDADETKLDGIEAGATADQTDAEIKTAYENNANTNAFTDADETKLDGIEALADVTDEANVTDALDGATLTNVAPQSTDKVLIQDVSDADNLKHVTAQSIADLNTPTKEAFFSPGTDSANQDNYSVRTAGSTAQSYLGFRVPHDFTSLVSLELIGWYVASIVAEDIDLNSSYASPGEDRTTHQESDTTTTYTETINQLTAIDLSGVFSAIVAGDICGLNIDHNGIGTTAKYVGVRMRYN